MVIKLLLLQQEYNELPEAARNYMNENYPTFLLLKRF
jgi:hypothetical protein